MNVIYFVEFQGSLAGLGEGGIDCDAPHPHTPILYFFPHNFYLQQLYVELPPYENPGSAPEGGCFNQVLLYSLHMPDR